MLTELTWKKLYEQILPPQEEANFLQGSLQALCKVCPGLPHLFCGVISSVLGMFELALESFQNKALPRWVFWTDGNE